MLFILFAAAVEIVSPEVPKPYEVTAAKELGAYLETCVPSGKVTIDADGTKSAQPRRVPPVFHVVGV